MAGGGGESSGGWVVCVSLSISSRMIWMIMLKWCLDLWKDGLAGKLGSVSVQLVNSARQFLSRGSLALIAVRISGLERMLLLVEGRSVRLVQKVRWSRSLGCCGVGVDVVSRETGLLRGVCGGGREVGSGVGGEVQHGGEGGGCLWVGVVGMGGVGSSWFGDG